MSYRGEVGDVVETRRGTFSCEWRIPDFLSLASENGDYYNSPVFKACDGEWGFVIYPHGLPGITSSEWVSPILCRLSEGPPQTLGVTLGIRGPGVVQRNRGRIREFSIDDCVCVWSRFCSRFQLTRQNSRLMAGNMLIVSLDMKMDVPQIAQDAGALLRSEQNVLRSGDDSEVTLKEQGMEELKESLKTLLVSGKDSDVVVKVQGKEFPAHRLVLQARSAVFEAMFSYDMVEKMRGVVTMEDCDQETFPDFLEHVYTGSVEMITTGNVFSLFSASDKYDLKTLKKACAEFVKKNLTVASFCDAITLAIKHDKKELTELAREFFCSHSLEICKTAEWQVFLMENTIVGNELIIKAFSK